MTDYAFAPHDAPVVPIAGGGLFPVRRIFCIGKNYADHVKEMGGDVKSDPPVFFTKPADAIVESGATVPYPPGTDNLHFEGELVIAIGQGGRDIEGRDDAGSLIFGTACGCDLTRRDLQSAAKTMGNPWDTAKAFDQSAPIGAIGRWQDFPPESFDDANLVTRVNDTERQNAPLATMIWSAPEIICALSRLFELKAGDLIFTGTPAGVGALAVGDKVEVEIGALPKLSFVIGRPQ